MPIEHHNLDLFPTYNLQPPASQPPQLALQLYSHAMATRPLTYFRASLSSRCHAPPVASLSPCRSLLLRTRTPAISPLQTSSLSTGHFWPKGMRLFSTGQRRASTKTSLMEMSGFSETQLQVREAVGKICEDFPDVSFSFYLVFSLVSLCFWGFH